MYINNKRLEKVLKTLLPLSLACSLLLCGCGEGQGRAPDGEIEMLDPPEAGCARLTDRQKKALRSDIEKCLMKMYAGEGKHFWIDLGGVALFDCDLDGTPEIAEFVPGGSMMNHATKFYDIGSARPVAKMDSACLTAALDGDTVIFITQDMVKVDANEYVDSQYEVSFNTVNGCTTYVLKFSSHKRLDEYANASEAVYTVADYCEPHTVSIDYDPIRSGTDGYSGKNNRFRTVTKEEYDKAVAAYTDSLRVLPASEMRTVYWSEIIPKGKTFEENPAKYVRLMAERLCASEQEIVYKVG